MNPLFFGMFSPERQKEILERERQQRLANLKTAVEWDEDKTKFAKTLVIKGSTFNARTYRYRLFDSCEAVPKLDDLKRKSLVWSPSKKFAYSNALMPKATTLELAQGHKRGKVYFDDDVVMPVLYSFNEKRYKKLQVWMGISPMEILTQRQGVRLAKGHCLIGGLGLGWLLRRVAEKKSVTKITLVEISQELLDWYGNDLCQRITEDTGTPIEVICDDVLQHMGKHGEDVRHLIDIWPDYPNYAHYLPKPWRDAIKSVKYFWGWGVLADPDQYR